MAAVYQEMGQRRSSRSATTWCRVRVTDRAGGVVAEWHLAGDGPPDLDAVDRLGRLALAVRRLGADVVLSDVSSELAELLWLAALPVEVEGQPEGGEEALVVEHVEEEAHPGDPAP